MLVSWKWLNELVEIKETPQEITDLLTMSGLEVEGLIMGQVKGPYFKVGLLREISKHPQADKLMICRVVLGQEKEKVIVTGAANVQVGQKVPVALPGAVLASGQKITPLVFRGVASEGMLCSAEELGLDPTKLSEAQKKGIYVLPDSVTVGADVVELLELDDLVLALDLTPNRADCLGMYNLAREVAVLTGGKLKKPLCKASQTGQTCATMVQVEIKAEELCTRYVARILKNVKIEPSPLWLQHRLLTVGIRPINNVVDLTNYIMLERGQPLHAFDYDALRGQKIIVRRALNGEKLVTLDDQLRELTPEMLIIADEGGPIALAGVMGGKSTEVTAQTKTILLEAAFFAGVSVRRTSHTLGLPSEAALRFAKGVDPLQAKEVADRTLQLLEEIGAGQAVEGSVDCYPRPEVKKPIKLRREKVNQILGTSLTAEIIEEKLRALQIEMVEKDETSWLFLPPSFRLDLVEEIDLIEEVARLYGYAQIPTTLPVGVMTPAARTGEQKLLRQIRKHMVAQGLFEVLNYSFINPQQLDSLGLPAADPRRDVVTVQNPLAEEQGIMRTTLLPGLLNTVRQNIHNRNCNLRLFELGKVYFAHGFPQERELPVEKWRLGVVVTGQQEKSWAYGARAYDFYYLKGIGENLLKNLGGQTTDLVVQRAVDLVGFHPGRTISLQLKGETIGLLGEIHPQVLEEYEIEQRVSFLSIALDKLEISSTKAGVISLSKYPAITRDLALVLPEEVAAEAVTQLIKQIGGTTLAEVRLFDLYRGPQIKEGSKSLAFSLTWQAAEQTLTDEAVNLLHEKIEKALQKKFKADLRY